MCTWYECLIPNPRALPWWLFLVLSCAADFAMIHLLSGCTGSSDGGRCVWGEDCLVHDFLRPSRHVGRRNDRTLAVIERQWETAVWALANFCFSEAKGIICDGAMFLLCPSCGHHVPMATRMEGTDYLPGCLDTTCPSFDEKIPITPSIAPSTLTKAFSKFRRLAGGVRGYPFLRGVKVNFQAPGLHCIGNMAKKVVNLILENSHETVKDVARINIEGLVQRSGLGSLYLRHWLLTVGAAVACRELLGADDKCFRLLLQLVQILNASWRSAFTEQDADDREGAAAVLELAASLLAPFYAVLKPLDVRTKSSGVQTLYLHAAVAHVRRQAGDARSAVAYVADDNVEGHMRGASRYLHARANNAPRAQIFTDLAVMMDVCLQAPPGARHDATSLLYTTRIEYCPCISKIGPDQVVDYEAALNIARNNSIFTVTEYAGGACDIELPLARLVETNAEPRRTKNGDLRGGKNEVLRGGLSHEQGFVCLCVCGNRTGEGASAVADQAKKAAWRRMHTMKNEEASLRADVRAAEQDARVQPRSRKGKGPKLTAPQMAHKRKIQRLLWESKLNRHLPPRSVAMAVFRGWIGASAESAGAASASTSTAIRGASALSGAEAGTTSASAGGSGKNSAMARSQRLVLELFRTRMHTPAFSLWMVQSKVSADDVRDATDTLITRFQECLGSVPAV